MILPVLKLGTLLLRSISKPIAGRLKRQAEAHPKFRQFIIKMAQANHRFTINIQRRIYGHATNVAIRPLNEEKAIQAAADLLGELFVFSVGGVAIIFEVQRSARSEARKEEAQRLKLEEMKQRDENIAREVEFLKRRHQELEQLVKGRGLSGLYSCKHTESPEQGKPANDGK